jgi:hypothetical protein
VQLPSAAVIRVFSITEAKALLLDEIQDGGDDTSN